MLTFDFCMFRLACLLWIGSTCAGGHSDCLTVSPPVLQAPRLVDEARSQRQYSLREFCVRRGWSARPCVRRFDSRLSGRDFIWGLFQRIILLPNAMASANRDTALYTKAVQGRGGRQRQKGQPGGVVLA